MSYFDEIKYNPNQISVDDGGRVRASTITTLGDYKILGFDKTLLLHTTGSGTGSFSKNIYRMSVTGSGQYLIRQSKKYHPYFSGKAQVIEATFDNFSPETEITKRVGYFSSNATEPYSSSYDGIFLESSASTIWFNVINSGTVIHKKQLSEWTGYDKVSDVDWDHFTVTYTDFLWLGGAVVRLWVLNNGAFQLAHKYSFAGENSGTFTHSPNQPLRYEIRSDSPNASGSFTFICAQVATEGGTEEAGISRTVDLAPAQILASLNTKYPLVAIKKNSLYRDIPVEVVGVGIGVATQNDIVQWSLEINPTFSTPLTYYNLASSSVQFATNTSAVTVTTSGSIIAAGIGFQNSLIQSDTLKKSYVAWLGSEVDNHMDEYVLCATPIVGAPITVYGALTFKEY